MAMNRVDISPCNEDGSSLIAVLIIITIISLLIGSVMMGMVIQNRFIQRDIDQLQLRYTAEAGIFHFLADSTLSILPLADSLVVHLFDSTEKAIIEVEPFGGFLSVTSRVNSRKDAKSIRTLVGNQPTTVFRNAVVLGDMHSTLNLTGGTNIHGDIAVGPLGVQRRAFKGKRFEGSVKGNVLKSEESVFPEFDKTLIQAEIAYCDSLLTSPPDRAIPLKKGKINFSNVDEINPGEIFIVNGDLEINSSKELILPENIMLIVTGNLVLKGPVVFSSFSRFIAGKNLIITGEFQGRNAIFYAGENLEIEGESSLAGQFIANNEIIIKGDTYLRYPSLLYLKGEVDEGIRSGRLELSGSSVVEGTLLIPGPEEAITEDETRLVVSEGSTVIGSLYNTGQTELHGRVLGSVLTLQFYFYHSPTAYINWLKGATVNVEERPENYVIPIGFTDERKFGLLERQEF